jgi:hypothetical protein
VALVLAIASETPLAMVSAMASVMPSAMVSEMTSLGLTSAGPYNRLHLLLYRCMYLNHIGNPYRW